ncbi:SDR family NAD(P)-dependent oxidoreductase [Streptomyces chromofuscus]|uniref:SDR family NAD(P)-dependent oxidoreductase n=1 Tax=Streptomyces chromofuscus TaxID=42881 RepID=UPI0016771BCC|nr:SDR family NAD(P)-dependent oxidoreductase [Streptomyces chromofuscus]GGT43199.1 oxidoreductase [Streptomyces chromofuscus]
MNHRLSGRTVIVTGGGSGLGAAACRRFAAEGASVVVADIDQTSAAEVAARIAEDGGTATGIRVDVSSETGTQAMAAAALERYGRIDVLYCNAGIPAVGTALSTERSTWDRALGVMLTGTWLSMRAVLPSMVQQRSGSVIVQSSVAGVVGVKALAPYTAAKAGALGLTRQAAADFAPFGIRVNAICPGTVPTPLVSGTLDAQIAAGLKPPRTHQEGLDRALAHYPLGRLGEPDDIANVALFLASDESSWITGQQFTVDGGFTAS